MKVQGLNGAIEIVRDRDGVPHIFATTDHDAFLGLGYVHAQDRLWQMEFQRRVRGAAQRSVGRNNAGYGQIFAHARHLSRRRGGLVGLDAAKPGHAPAYTDGINAWLSERHTLPPEFLILGIDPERWTTTDSLVWAKMMAWDLAGDYKLELLRLRLTQAIQQ